MDGIEQEFAGKLEVIRLDIQEEVGQELGQVYGFEFTPTFIFFDEVGNEVWRVVGDFDEERIRHEMSSR